MEKMKLQQTKLETELAELRPLAAAAKEAYAFLSGRRPGFAPTYAYDVLRSAIEPREAAQAAKDTRQA